MQAVEETARQLREQCHNILNELDFLGLFYTRQHPNPHFDFKERLRQTLNISDHLSPQDAVEALTRAERAASIRLRIARSHYLYNVTHIDEGLTATTLYHQYRIYYSQVQNIDSEETRNFLYQIRRSHSDATGLGKVLHQMINLAGNIDALEIMLSAPRPRRRCNYINYAYYNFYDFQLKRAYLRYRSLGLSAQAFSARLAEPTLQLFQFSQQHDIPQIIAQPSITYSNFHLA